MIRYGGSTWARLRRAVGMVTIGATVACAGEPAARSGTTPAANDRPNIIVILADDMGFSDVGAYGGEIETPNIDRLAAEGLQFTRFYSYPRCVPTRAALMTGLYPHQADLGGMDNDAGVPGYRGDLSEQSVTIAEVLQAAGYATWMSGKWHLTSHTGYWGRHPDKTSKHNWPRQRGFDRFFGTISGAGSFYAPSTLVEDNSPVESYPADFYYTDEIADHAIGWVREHRAAANEQPFFLYLAFTAPHWPLHALEEDIAKYAGRYDDGWEPVREARYARQLAMGLTDSTWAMSPPDPGVRPWAQLNDQERRWYRRAMEVYAAQIDRMDRNIGRLLDELEGAGYLDNTLILFLSDNGACAEILTDEWNGIYIAREQRDGSPVTVGNEHVELLPGPEATYMSYGREWANASNTPFRFYKHWTHEGGISSPFLVRWPAGLQRRGVMTPQVGHLIDIMPTLVDVGLATYPAERQGVPVLPMEGVSLLPAFEGTPVERGPLFWEHEGSRAMRSGDWKLVSGRDGWELYDLAADRTEQHDLSASNPERVAEMAVLYEEWAARANVRSWPLDTDLR